MRPDRSTFHALERPPSRQRGFGLVAALFVMIVVGAAIAAMMQLASVQHTTAALSLLQARVYQAARAGGEWGIVGLATSEQACSAGNQSLDIDGVNVVVSCSSVASPVLDEESVCQTENGVEVCTAPRKVFYTISSVATYGSAASGDYVFRNLTVVVER